MFTLSIKEIRRIYQSISTGFWYDNKQSTGITRIVKAVLRFICCVLAFILGMGYAILPLRLRVIYVKLFALFGLIIKPIFGLRLPPNVDRSQFGDPIPEDKEQDVIVLFSGGSDSTLDAAEMVPRFRKVHLVTYKHCGISHIENSLWNADNLKRTYGEDKFVHRIIDINHIFRKTYMKNAVRDFFKYYTYSLGACGICKFSMHIMSIVYCLKNNIKYVTDGSANFYGMMAPNEMRPVLQQIKKFYADYGITFIINPNYTEPRADHVLYERGVVPEDNIRADYSKYINTQPICSLGIFFLLITKLYYIYRYGNDRLIETSVRYYNEKIPVYKKYIEEELQCEPNEIFVTKKPDLSKIFK